MSTVILGAIALKIPWTCFYDDYIVVAPCHHTRALHRAVSSFFRLLGWTSAEEGSKATPFRESFEALGLEVDLSESNGGIAFLKTDATMLHELLPQESEQRQQEDVEVSSPRTPGAISSSSRPQFEVVGSPSKIPRLRPELPRFGAGNVGRVKMPSDDIILDVEEQVFQEPLSEDEEFFDVEESDQEEELEVKEEAEEDDEDEADPEFSEAFQREELGPREVSDEALERFDERATKKEINRLGAMGVLQDKKSLHHQMKIQIYQKYKNKNTFG